MTDKIPKIYLDACPLIDMAQHEADGGTSGEIGKCVWFCTQILRAARDKKVKVLTSFLSVAECTSINTNGAAQPSPAEETKRFYDMLLLSGKSGVELVPITQALATRARDLRWVSDLNLKGADTIHVASALQMKCDELWTRDGRIWRYRVKLGQMGVRVLKPCETQVLPSEYRTGSLFPE